MIRTALQLGLSGISKIGWPGVIVIEGDENACQEYVRYVSSLRWKQLTVRGEEVYEMKEEDNCRTDQGHRHLIEILNLELDNISVTAEKTNKKFETRVNVSSLQIDNCLRNSYVHI